MAAYRQIRIGDPLDAGTLMGPLIDDGCGGEHDARARTTIREQGGEVI